MYKRQAFFIDRKQIHAGTIIFPVVTTITMRILTPLIHADTLLHSVLFCIAGICIIAMSIALSIYADCGKNPYDCVTFGLMNRTGLSYHVIRWILDGSMLISGILLHGTYGVVTIINLLVLGKLITAALALLRRQSLSLIHIYGILNIQPAVWTWKGWNQTHLLVHRAF